MVATTDATPIGPSTIQGEGSLWSRGPRMRCAKTTAAAASASGRRNTPADSPASDTTDASTPANTPTTGATAPRRREKLLPFAAARSRRDAGSLAGTASTSVTDGERSVEGDASRSRSSSGAWSEGSSSAESPTASREDASTSCTWETSLTGGTARTLGGVAVRSSSATTRSSSLSSPETSSANVTLGDGRRSSAVDEARDATGGKNGVSCAARSRPEDGARPATAPTSFEDCSRTPLMTTGGCAERAADATGGGSAVIASSDGRIDTAST